MARGHIRPARTAAGREGRAWQVVVEARDPDGSRRQQWVTVHGSRRDAERERTRLQREADTGALASARGTVGEYLQQWLDGWARHNVAPQTLVCYGARVRRWEPIIGSRPLAKLSALDVQAGVSAMLDAGLAPITVRVHLIVLRGALRQAVRWKLITANPAADVSLPRLPARVKRALSEAQALSLLEAAAADRDGLAVVLALGCALRAGEVFALRFPDVDFAAGQLHVRRSLQVLVPGEKEPKSGRTRAAPLPEFVRLALLREQAEQEEIRRGLRQPDWNPSGLVICNHRGEQVYKRTTDIMARICAAASIPRARMHDLRHTLATILLENGESVRAVAEVLGHADASVTLNVYADVLAEAEARTAARIEALLGKRAGLQAVCSEGAEGGTKPRHTRRRPADP